MAIYKILENFEIEGNKYEAGSSVELSDELVSKISKNFIQAEEVAPVEEAPATEEEAPTDTVVEEEQSVTEEMDDDSADEVA